MVFKKGLKGAAVVVRLELTIASVRLLRMSFLETSFVNICRLEFIKSRDATDA